MHTLPFIFTQHIKALAEDEETPIHLFMKETRNQPGILLESVEVGGRWGRYTLVAKDFLLVVRPVDGALSIMVQDPALRDFELLNGMPWLEGLRALYRRISIKAKAQQEFPAITRALYGYLGYGVSGLMEPKLAESLPASEAESCLVLPGTVFLFDHVYNKLVRMELMDKNGQSFKPIHELSNTTSGAIGDDAFGEPEIGALSTSPNAEEYMGMVRDIKELIKQGEVIQVVVSTGFSTPFHGDAFTLYCRLRRINPSPYMFFMRLPGITLFGSSPEVLVSADKNRLRLCPIAGTRPRGRDADEDDLFSLNLIHDPKERAEHVMLVDLGRNDLGRVAAFGTVKVDRYMEVERFSHVMHLTSYVSADLAPDKDAFDILAAAFPAGTVSGAPKIRAMELIARMERSARGPYAGAIGWIGLDADSANLDLGITIRSAWVRNGKLYWQAGAGIVFDSDPEMEWKECNNKAAALRSVFKGERYVSAH